MPEVSKAQAGEYNHILLVDKSGSMGSPSTRYPGKSRWQEAAEFATGFASYIGQVDDDGFDMVLFGGGPIKTFTGLKTAEVVAKVFSNEDPGGSTPLAQALLVAQTLREKGGKRAMVHVLTDGAPDDEGAVIRAIGTMVGTMNDDADLAINIMQIGNDPAVAKFLTKLDDGLNLKFDAVNCISAEEAEKLSYGEVLYLALND